MWQTARNSHLATRLVRATTLLKLSKHTALLVSLLILGKAAGRYDIGEPTLLGLAIVAALLQMGAKALTQRAVSERFPPSEPK